MRTIRWEILRKYIVSIANNLTLALSMLHRFINQTSGAEFFREKSESSREMERASSPLRNLHVRRWYGSGIEAVAVEID